MLSPGRRPDKQAVTEVTPCNTKGGTWCIQLSPWYRPSDQGIVRDWPSLVVQRLSGGPYHPDSFSGRFERLIKSAGLPHIRLHDLRHTHATLALQAGVHPKVVSERLGHASIAITLDVCSHAIPALQEEAAEKVAALVFGG